MSRITGNSNSAVASLFHLPACGVVNRCGRPGADLQLRLGARYKQSLRAMVSKASILGILLLSAAMTRAGSIPPEQVKPLTDLYTIRSWNVIQGLPENEVRGLAFGPDGFLWIITPHRLARFDGVQFDYPLLEPANGFRGLCFDQQGRLWIHGTGGAWFYDAAGWKAVFPNSDKPLPEHDVLKLAQAADGTMWLLTAGGLYAWKDSRLQSYPCPPSMPATARLAGLTIDIQGTIWLAATNRILRFKAGQYDPCLLPADMKIPKTPAFWFIHSGHSGHIWTATREDLIFWQDQAWHLVPTPQHSSTFEIPGEFLEAADGGLWIASDIGLYRYLCGQWWSSNHNEAELPMTCRVIACDPMGNIWVGTNGGLVRLSPRRIQPIATVPVEAGTRRVSSVTILENRELLAGFTGPYLMGGGVDGLRSLPEARLIPNVTASALWKDANGYVWAGSQGTLLWRLKGSERIVVADFKGIFHPKGTRIQTMRQVADGAFWVGTNDGLMKCVGPSTKPVLRVEKGGDGPESVVTALHEDRDGGLWVGYESEGLGRRAPDGKFHLFHEPDGLPGSGVYAIWKDADGVLWLGGRRGLARWDGQNHWLVPTECGFGGLPVTQIVEDEHKRLWLGTPDGIWGLSRSELAEVAAGQRARLHARRLGVDEGMPAAQCAGSFNYAGMAPPKDRLYFGTAGGLVSFDPKSISPAGPPPQVRLQSVAVSGREIWRDSLAAPAIPGELTLAPGARQIRIAFTAFHYASPDQLRFSYRLSGPQAGAWSPLSRDRVAQFEYLPAGRHELHVIACSSDGAWNETGLMLVLNVKPWFWQTPWFLGLVVLAFAAAAGLTARTITRRRWKARVEKLKQTEALHQERTRIAQDMHDEIGSKLTRISYLAEMEADLGNHPPESRDHIHRVAATARDAIRSLEQVIWSVGPQYDTLSQLIGRIFRYAEEYFADTPVRCRFATPPSIPPLRLTPEVRQNVFAACKEAMNNVLKHSHATGLQIEVAMLPRWLQVEISDDGCGFDVGAALPDAGIARGNGLPNLYKRMRDIAGECEIISHPGRGTRVRLRMPLVADSTR